MDKNTAPRMGSRPQKSRECVLCLPFCGLDKNAGIVQRVAACSGRLLEHAAAHDADFVPVPHQA